MGKNIMPRIGVNLETLGKTEYTKVPKTTFVTLEEFKEILDLDISQIIAVKMNNVFTSAFKTQVPNYEIFSECEYFIVNIKYIHSNLDWNVGHYSDNLREEALVEKVYELIPTYEEICLNKINEVLTIAEASSAWNKEVSTLRRNFTANASFKLGIDCRKSGSTWLVTKDAMERVYGKPENQE